MALARIGALIVVLSPIYNERVRQITDLAGRNRLPASYATGAQPEAGTPLPSYGANTAQSYAQAARLVDKILKVAKPGDLPIEEPSKFEFVLNLKTAKQLGLVIPESILVRADTVI